MRFLYASATQGGGHMMAATIVVVVVVVPEPVGLFLIVARSDSQVIRCAEAFGHARREEDA